MKVKHLSLLPVFLALGSINAEAKLIDAKPNGFMLEHQYEFDKTPGQVFNAIIHPEKWWLADHTWSGKSKNLYLEPRAMGCFCERLEPKGSVAHMQVVFINPDHELRLGGALGPMQNMGAYGHLNYQVIANGSGSILKISFSVGGYSQMGFEKLAPIVDNVMTQQFDSLSNHLKKENKK